MLHKWYWILANDDSDPTTSRNSVHHTLDASFVMSNNIFKQTYKTTIWSHSPRRPLPTQGVAPATQSRKKGSLSLPYSIFLEELLNLWKTQVLCYLYGDHDSFPWFFVSCCSCQILPQLGYKRQLYLEYSTQLGAAPACPYGGTASLQIPLGTASLQIALLPSALGRTGLME